MPAQCVGGFVTSIAAICEDMTQLGEAVADCLDEVDCAVTVLDAGGMNRHEQHQPQCIGDYVTLAPHDLLARVIAAHSAAFGGFDALAVDHPCAWAGLAPFDLARSHHQHVIDRLPQAAVAPSVEIALDRRKRRKILRQHSPLTAAGRQIEDRVHHFAHIGAARTTTNLRGRKQRFDQRPFRIAQIAWITKPARLCCLRVISVHIAQFLVVSGETPESTIQQRVKHNRLISQNYF